VPVTLAYKGAASAAVVNLYDLPGVGAHDELGAYASDLMGSDSFAERFAMSMDTATACVSLGHVGVAGTAPPVAVWAPDGGSWLVTPATTGDVYRLGPQAGNLGTGNGIDGLAPIWGGIVVGVADAGKLIEFLSDTGLSDVAVSGVPSDVSVRIRSGAPGVVGDEVLVDNNGAAMFIDQNGAAHPALVFVDGGYRPLAHQGSDRWVGASPSHVTRTLVILSNLGGLNATITVARPGDAGVVIPDLTFNIGPFTMGARISLDGGSDERTIAVVSADGTVGLLIPP
jgi:hypothetical protein